DSTPAGSSRPPRVASAPVSSRPSASAYTADGSSGEASNSSGSTRPDPYRTAATVCDVPKSTPSAAMLASTASLYDRPGPPGINQSPDFPDRPRTCDGTNA